MLSSIIDVSDREYKLLAALIYAKSGINLGDKKKELVKNRLMKRIKDLNCQTYQQYYRYILNDVTGQELIQLLNAVSTNTTSFFRGKHHFEFMVDRVLPEIMAIKRKKGSFKLRVWSAACSSGEEVYSLIIVLNEYFKNLSGWDIKVLGTDISTKQLAKAANGKYEFEKLEGVSFQFINKYFDIIVEGQEKFYKVKHFLKNMAVFRSFNLMEETFPFRESLDIIFCRNVMIYFDRDTQQVLINKLYKCIAKGGYLFIGHTESLIRINTEFKSVAPAVMKKE
ncbi:MAG: protein-glutamate O-methyltransferase CheR [Candidatus Omnitrophica bacterium]|nr:protein-glutamate O-methyltransferase CheR [Candidatus Omnitrophota bacterium]